VWRSTGASTCSDIVFVLFSGGRYILNEPNIVSCSVNPRTASICAVCQGADHTGLPPSRHPRHPYLCYLLFSPSPAAWPRPGPCSVRLVVRASDPTIQRSTQGMAMSIGRGVCEATGRTEGNKDREGEGDGDATSVRGTPVAHSASMSIAHGPSASWYDKSAVQCSRAPWLTDSCATRQNVQRTTSMGAETLFRSLSFSLEHRVRLVHRATSFSSLPSTRQGTCSAAASPPEIDRVYSDSLSRRYRWQNRPQHHSLRAPQLTPLPSFKPNGCSRAHRRRDDEHGGGDGQHHDDTSKLERFCGRGTTNRSPPVGRSAPWQTTP